MKLAYKKKSDDHVESDDNLTQKSRLFFSKAVNMWDADFYVKMDDNGCLYLDLVGTLLSGHEDKKRAYVGCMKAGVVVFDPIHKLVIADARMRNGTNLTSGSLETKNLSSTEGSCKNDGCYFRLD